MLRGDISNQRSFVFGFRCESSLFHFKDRSVLDKVKNYFSGKMHRAEVNEEVLSLMRYLYWNTEYTVVLVIDDKNYTEEAQDFLKDFPFNQVLNVHGVSEITSRLYTGELSYYVDDNDATRYLVQNPYAITSAELNQVLRRHYGRLT